MNAFPTKHPGKLQIAVSKNCPPAALSVLCRCKALTDKGVNHLEDTQIVALFFSRSEEAISETSKKYGSYLRTIACNILPSSEDAEEIINDVYLAAWDSIPPKRPSVLKYYLSRIVRNLCFKRVEYLTAEKRGGNADILLSELEECIPDTCRDMEQILEAKELGQLLNRFLGTLNSSDRKLFLSRYYYAMTAPQLAEKYGCSVRQVKYRLGKMRKELKHTLQKGGM
ncbi:MAG: sigma-70 family RNA polymerase sigma factor [Candidatus Faecousia sp.]|nr:sigma-70 family RNA polymerase sigma factor [Candidatus Faecousia sp.]